MSNTPIPINLITGLLGSGKTTAITNLIQQKPPQENWGILINEFGEIGIDAAHLHSQSNSKHLSILEVSGGCICCTAQFGLTQSLNQLLTQSTRLDRILIEPTGLGHPAKIIDTLLQNGWAHPIQLSQIICLLTPQQLTPQRWQKSKVMRDLVTLADQIFINQTDTATSKEIDLAQKVLAQCYPPKDHISLTQFAQLTLNHLQAQHHIPPQLFLSGQTQHQAETACQTQAIPSILPEVLQCKIQQGEQTQTIGWIFSPKLQLNRSKFIKITQAWTNLLRAKGLFKTGNEWQLINGVNHGKAISLQFSDIAWRQDNRLELIFNAQNHQNTTRWVTKIEHTLLEALRVKTQ